MEELNPDQVEELIWEQNPNFLYFYTPLCGTCQLASTMLSIVAESFEDLSLYKCNLNYAPDIATKYKIESVPCLTIWRNGKMKDKIYAFHSVHHLYEMIKNMNDK